MFENPDSFFNGPENLIIILASTQHTLESSKPTNKMRQKKMRKEKTQELLNADPGRLADLGSTTQKKMEISGALFYWWGKSTSHKLCCCDVVALLRKMSIFVLSCFFKT